MRLDSVHVGEVFGDVYVEMSAVCEGEEQVLASRVRYSVRITVRLDFKGRDVDVVGIVESLPEMVSRVKPTVAAKCLELKTVVRSRLGGVAEALRRVTEHAETASVSGNTVRSMITDVVGGIVTALRHSLEPVASELGASGVDAWQTISIDVPAYITASRG